MNDCPREYPSLTEVAPCMLGLVEQYRAGTLFDDKAHTAKRLWNIQGAALDATFGDPDVPPLVGDVPVTSDEQAIDILEEAAPSPGVVEAKAVPWPLILAAVQFLLKKFLK